MSVVVVSNEVAHRTLTAYPQYLRTSNAATLVVNPNLSDDRAAQLITTTPGIAAWTTQDLLAVGIDEERPVTQAEVDALPFTARSSTDGGFVTQDRPVVDEGRMVESGDEVFLNRRAAALLDASVGDQLPLAFYRPSFTVGLSAPEFGLGPDDISTPIGRATARVVGIGTTSTDVLPDELYPQPLMILSPDLGAAHTCTFSSIDDDPALTIEQHLEATFPADCALSYRYFWLKLEHGAAGVGPVVDELTARFERANADLPPVVRQSDIAYTPIPTLLGEERDRVADSVRPVATTLRLFGLVVGAATLALTLLTARRLARRHQPDDVIFKLLGATSAERLGGSAVPMAASVWLGVVIATIGGLIGSRIGAVASVSAVDPDPQLGLSVGSLTILVAAGVALTVGVLAVVRIRPARPLERPSVVLGLTAALQPPRRLGAHAAIRGPGALVITGGSTVAVVVVLASLTFASGVARLLATPADYGWPYDGAAIIGFGYGGSDIDAIARSLDRPEVDRWGMAALTVLSIDGQAVPGVGERRGFSRLDLPLISGRRPSAANEIALGLTTADQLGIEVGDDVTVNSDYGSAPAVVTGLVVLPPVGGFGSTRAGSGTGAYLSEAFSAGLLARAEAAQGLPSGSLEGVDGGAFLAIDAVDGERIDDVFDTLGRDELRSWSRQGFEPYVYPHAVRPAAIADVASIRSIPIVLSGLIAVAMALALAVGIAAATRARRRELAILGALGCTARQIASSVRWHSLTVSAIAVVLGTPIGLAAGRTLYRLFASDLGVRVTNPSWTLLAGAVDVGTIAAALCAGSLPARRTARLRLSPTRTAIDLIRADR